MSESKDNQITTLEDLAEGVVSIPIVVPPKPGYQEMIEWVRELAQSMGMPTSLLCPPKDKP